MSYYVGTGKTKALITNDLENVKAYIDKLLPGARAILEREAREVYQYAWQRWPIDTGTSRAGLSWGVLIAPDASFIRGFVMNNVDYARYIKSSQVRTGTGHAMTELLRKPIAERTDTITAELGPALRRAMED